MDPIIDADEEWPKTQTGGPDDDECEDIIVAGEPNETTLSEFEGGDD